MSFLDRVVSSLQNHLKMDKDAFEKHYFFY